MKRKKKTQDIDIKKMVYKEAPSPAIWWFILALIPLLNLYFYWKVAKMIAESER